MGGWDRYFWGDFYSVTSTIYRPSYRRKAWRHGPFSAVDQVQCRPAPSYVQWSMWLHCPQIMQSVGHAWLHLWMTLLCCQHNNRENGLSTDLSMCFHFSYTLDVLNCSQKIHVYSAALCFNADDRVQEVRPKETFFGMPVPTAFLLTTSLLNRYDSCCQSPTARIFLRLLIKHFCSD